MNIEAYDLDSLWRLIRSLQDENKRLKEQLDNVNIPYNTENVFAEKIENIQEYDPDQGGRILNQFITKALANRYFPCSGAGPMYMPREERRTDILPSVIIPGITAFVQNSGVRSKVARHVSTRTGQSLHLRKS